MKLVAGLEETPETAALAVASRLLLTLTEFGAAAPFLLLTRRSSRVVL
jgi:hypothetical protein